MCMQCILVITDVASSWAAWPLDIEPIICPKMLITINLCCLTFQNSEDFIYTRREPEIVPKMFKKWAPTNIVISIF
jgi:hypothetical protein